MSVLFFFCIVFFILPLNSGHVVLHASLKTSSCRSCSCSNAFLTMTTSSHIIIINIKTDIFRTTRPKTFCCRDFCWPLGKSKKSFHAQTTNCTGISVNIGSCVVRKVLPDNLWCWLLTQIVCVKNRSLLSYFGRVKSFRVCLSEMKR